MLALNGLSSRYGSKNRRFTSWRRPVIWRCSESDLAVAEQVRLLDLRRGDEVLDAREAGADLERAGRALADLDVDVHLVGRRALLGRDVDALEVAERRDAAPRLLELRLAEELAFGDLHLATDHLVARLRVAADLDALEMHERAALDRHDHVDLVASRGRGSSAESASTLA